MADDIKIKVGVQNNVKAGMGSIVKDIRAQGEALGHGFGAAFKQAAQGNITGAINAIFGGLVAGAAKMGWEVGQAIDNTFKVSDKIAGWFLKEEIDSAKALGAQLDKIKNKFKELREAQEKAMRGEATPLQAAEEKLYAGSPDLQAKKKAAESEVARYEMAGRDMGSLKDVDRVELLTKRQKAYENLKKIEQEIFDIGTKKAVSYAQKRKELEDQWAQDKLNAALAAEKAYDDKKKEQAEKDKERISKAIDGLKEKSEAEKNAGAKAIQAIDAEIKALDEKIAKGKEGAAKAMQAVVRPDEWRAEQKAEQQAKRDESRRRKMLDEWAKQEAAGRPLSKRAKDALDAADKANAGLKAEAEKKKAEDKEAKLKADMEKQQAIDIAAIRKMQEQLLTLK